MLVPGVVLVSGCGAAPAGSRGTPTAATRDAVGGATGPSPKAPPPPKPWEHAAVLPTLRPVTAWGRSQHFAGDLDAQVLANELAASYPRVARDASFSAGAILVEQLRAPGRAEPTVQLAMAKGQPGSSPASGDWEFLVLSPDGKVEERGALPRCSRCHAEAPQAFVFGGPR